nr:Asp23/Gls24 family envelope stress response protein [Rhizohabitans arisaemae]
MRTTPSQTTPAKGAEQSVPQQQARERQAVREGGGSRLLTDQGNTTISDTVVAKIAGMAAREVRGVRDFGVGTARAFGAIKERLPGGDYGSATRGIAVEVGERQAAADIDLVVEYGISIPDLANAVRKNVIGAVERMCGLEVTEVNILVDDVWLPGQERTQQQQQTGATSEPRVK